MSRSIILLQVCRPSSFETDRKRFLGENEYGTWQSPRGLLADRLTNSQAERGDNISALMVPLGVLEPGSSRTFTTMLGQEPSLKKAIPVIRKFKKPENIDRLWVILENSGKNILSYHPGRNPGPVDELDDQCPQSTPMLHDQAVVTVFILLPARVRRARNRHSRFIPGYIGCGLFDP